VVLKICFWFSRILSGAKIAQGIWSLGQHFKISEVRSSLNATKTKNYVQCPTSA